MKITVLILLVLVSATSCTITKQHYSNGFHVEWKKRLTTNHSKTTPPQIKAKDEVFAIDTVAKTITVYPENDVQPDTRIRQQEEKRYVDHGISDEHVKTPLATSSSQTKAWKLTTPKALKKNKGIQKNAAQQQVQTKGFVRMSNFWEAVTDFLFWAVIILLLLLTPPVIHTILIALLPGFDRKTTLFTVLEWLLWAGGIIAILLLLTGVWPIVLACLGVNILFAVVGTAITTIY